MYLESFKDHTGLENFKVHTGLSFAALIVLLLGSAGPEHPNLTGVLWKDRIEHMDMQIHQANKVIFHKVTLMQVERNPLVVDLSFGQTQCCFVTVCYR